MLLRIATAGSVDDGKSTLIGRLLHDRGLLTEDQLGEVGDDLAWVTDGLRDEREQKITIDVAYRYFGSAKRRFILADTPGHEHYTHNMITGISTAELVILLVDARKGLTEQSRRHALLCSLMGIPQLVLAVNKMDAVGYAEEVFLRIQTEFVDYCRRLDIGNLYCLPVSALRGDNVVESGEHMPWFDGPTLYQYLHQVHPGGLYNVLDFRFAVQCVLRPHQDFRGLAGRVCSGRVRPGQPVVVLPAGHATRVRALYGPDGTEWSEAEAGDCPVITLEDEVEAGRGAILARRANQPELGSELDVTLCWLNQAPLRLGANYWLLHNSRRLRCQVDHLHYALDVNQLRQRAAAQLEKNEIGRAHLRASEALAFDPYLRNRAMGSFVLVDLASHQTVAAGMIRARAVPRQPRGEVFFQEGSVSRSERQQRNGHRACILWFTGLPGAGKTTLARALERRLFDRGCSPFFLDGDNLRHGLNRDLGFSAADRRENIRRAAEVAQLAHRHGHIVLASFISPFAREREEARALVPEGDFFEIHVDCPLEECARRDVKGLYARARRGEISEFTGVSSPYEVPSRPELRLDTAGLTVEQACQSVLGLLEERRVLS